MAAAGQMILFQTQSVLQNIIIMVVDYDLQSSGSQPFMFMAHFGILFLVVHLKLCEEEKQYTIHMVCLIWLLS